MRYLREYRLELDLVVDRSLAVEIVCVLPMVCALRSLTGSLGPGSQEFRAEKLTRIAPRL